ncbi:MAG TPA: isoprenylcysteine carboxylmethyltransferase family protein [Oleiagrimonas sp.]|nr:isoprenylcysteine carboxylmethyltransferase family protein [Oleiagrimonas sp.]
MALREELEANGNWLFRKRSYLPVLFIPVFILALRGYTYFFDSPEMQGIWVFFCLTTSYLGLGIRVWTIGHTPKGTSGRSNNKQTAECLNTTGMYSVVRNPLYLGNFFMGLGMALFAHSWWLVAIYTMAFWLYYERIILAEEAFLKSTFGQTYLEWADRTPAFVPDLKKYKKPALPFSPRNVLRREYNGFFTILVVMSSLKAYGDLSYLGKLDFNLEWRVFMASGFAIWLILRSLKRHTRILKVEGR